METISLQKHYDDILRERDKFNDEREKRFQERFKAQEEAIRIADIRLQEYKAQANEWRGQSKDREDSFLSKTTHHEFEKAIDEKISVLQRLVYIGIGGLIVIELLMKYLIK